MCVSLCKHLQTLPCIHSNVCKVCYRVQGEAAFIVALFSVHSLSFFDFKIDRLFELQKKVCNYV